jgi:LmbE family N-acetylglucosaminyl deacetylase
MDSTTHELHPTTSHPARPTVADLADQLPGGPGVLLAVWAHPDDESFLAAGLMAEVARRGGRVVNVTATLGEQGLTDDHSSESLASRRGRELDAALAALGVAERAHLGYGDGACARVPDELAARHLGVVIDEIAPDAVIGFVSDGVTGHPDHRAVARWTARALAARGNRIPLLTTAVGATWPDACVQALDGIDAFLPGFPVRRGHPDDVTVRLDDALLRRKLAALSCHASQMGPVRAALGPHGLRRLASVEAYRPANAAARRLLDRRPVRASA